MANQFLPRFTVSPTVNTKSQTAKKRLQHVHGSSRDINSRNMFGEAPPLRQRNGRVFRKLILVLAVLPLFTILSLSGGMTSRTAVQFTDVTSEAKINFKHEDGASKDKIMVETFGSGVAWMDYDNDGYIDLLFVNGANLSQGKPSPGNALFRNTGKGTFVDVTKEAGLAGNERFGTGVAVGDFDNDGFLDIYITGLGGNTLYHNDRNGTFTDVTTKAGV